VRTARYVLYTITLLVVAALAWNVRQGAAADRRAQQVLAAKVAVLEAAPPRTERIVERQTRVEVSASASPQRVDAEVTDPAVDQEQTLERHDMRARTTTDLAVGYAQQFSEEPVDSGWAREARGTYLSSVQSALPASSHIESFECRSKFCDLLVVHDDIDTSNGFLRSLFGLQENGSLLGRAGGFRAAAPTPTSDGKLAYHVYIARPGTVLALEEPPPAAGLPGE
jgi:hypothetical protein